MRYILILLCVLLIQPSFAKVFNYQTDNFEHINYIYQKISLDPKTTLLAFDLDDTLITMTQPLGSVGWWDWQVNLLKTGNDPEKLFTTDMNQLVRIQNILFQLIKMEVTDEKAIPFIKQTVHDGATIIGLTARGQEHLSATFMQLKDNKFTENGNLIFKEYGLRFNGKSSTTDRFYCPQFTRDVIYQNGIMFLSGEDKGQSLSCILKNARQNIKTIIFVDDAKRNTQSIDNAFANRNDVNVINILFTKENAKEDEIQNNSTLQAQIVKDWKHIKKSLHDVIIQSNF
jgi:hypothetical protein